MQILHERNKLENILYNGGIKIKLSNMIIRFYGGGAGGGHALIM